METEDQPTAQRGLPLPPETASKQACRACARGVAHGAMGAAAAQTHGPGASPTAGGPLAQRFHLEHSFDGGVDTVDDLFESGGVTQRGGQAAVGERAARLPAAQHPIATLGARIVKLFAGTRTA